MCHTAECIVHMPLVNTIVLFKVSKWMVPKWQWLSVLKVSKYHIKNWGRLKRLLNGSSHLMEQISEYLVVQLVITLEWCCHILIIMLECKCLSMSTRLQIVLEEKSMEQHLIWSVKISFKYWTMQSKFQGNNEDNEIELQWVLKYLHGMVYLSLTLDASDLKLVMWWVNASFAVKPDYRSHTAAVVPLGKGAITSISREQRIN